ncbi:MAG: hypothetical protein IPN37_07195 [Betaproteobacteria bacterium]|nr:hypothetical protein [Betaproteobacteria bacterium]
MRTPTAARLRACNGIDIAGMPVALNSGVNGMWSKVLAASEAITATGAAAGVEVHSRHASPLLGAGLQRPGGGGAPSVGDSSTSTCSKNGATSPARGQCSRRGAAAAKAAALSERPSSPGQAAGSKSTARGLRPAREGQLLDRATSRPRAR